MRLSLRWRIILTLVPLLLVLGVLGSAGVWLLHNLGGRIELILRENYRSVLYMERLNEAMERIDSSFVFAIAGQEKQAREQYGSNWMKFDENLRLEQENITVQGESELVDQLVSKAKRYRQSGQLFYDLAPNSQDRHQAYFGPQGKSLLNLFQEIKAVSGDILRINQANMEQASQSARDTASTSLTWFGAGLALAVLLALFLAWRTAQTIVHPLRIITNSALAISEGNPDQVVPEESKDELGKLAQAFNVMARHLRDFRDSQSAQLLRVQRTSQATIDSFPDPVLVIDTEGQVEMANPAARQLLGVVPKDKSPSIALIWQPPGPLHEPLVEALHGIRDYLPEGFDKTILLTANGSDRVLLPRIMTIRDPNKQTLGAAVLLQDVTRLRMLDQVKSNLVATASHELKTPLTSLRLVVHLLLEESAGPITPKQMELLMDARENSERLLAVVNNLLDLARLEQGSQQLNVQPESPATLLRTAADTIIARAKDKNVEVELDVTGDTPAVSVDVERIGHALRNLLDNALTYTDRGGKIELSVKPDHDAVIFTVMDTGIGIQPEHVPHVFDKFFRIPGQSRGGSTGLGLAIVREIVTAHGGTVTCESQPGTGTAFHIRLPKAIVNMPPIYVYGHANDSLA